MAKRSCSPFLVSHCGEENWLSPLHAACAVGHLSGVPRGPASFPTQIPNGQAQASATLFSPPSPRHLTPSCLLPESPHSRQALWGSGGGGMATSKMSQVQLPSKENSHIIDHSKAHKGCSPATPLCPARSFQSSLSCPNRPAPKQMSTVLLVRLSLSWGRRKDLREGRDRLGTKPFPRSKDNCSTRHTMVLCLYKPKRGGHCSPAGGVASQLPVVAACGVSRRKEGHGVFWPQCLPTLFKIQTLLAIPGQQESHTQLVSSKQTQQFEWWRGTLWGFQAQEEQNRCSVKRVT